MPNMKHDNDFNEESGREDLVDEQAAAWFVRMRAENVADEEKAAFARWLAHDPAHRQAYADICMLWGDAALKQALSEAETKSPEISRLKKKRALNNGCCWLWPPAWRWCLSFALS